MAGGEADRLERFPGRGAGRVPACHGPGLLVRRQKMWCVPVRVYKGMAAAQQKLVSSYNGAQRSRWAVWLVEGDTLVPSGMAGRQPGVARMRAACQAACRGQRRQAGICGQ